MNGTVNSKSIHQINTVERIGMDRNWKRVPKAPARGQSLNMWMIDSTSALHNGQEMGIDNPFAPRISLAKNTFMKALP